jgi:RNA polymerase sigma-70 factor (ECF subfamily)
LTRPSKRAARLVGTHGAGHRMKSLSDEQFVLLLPKYFGRLRAFLSTMLPTCHDIDEVVQDACLVAWRKYADFHYQNPTPDEEFVRWVCSIAKYEALRYRRENVRRELVFDESLLEHLADIQLHHAERLIRRETILQDCLHRLPEKDRSLVQQRYRAGGSAAAAAEDLGRTVSAVHKALARIRRLLANCVDRVIRSEGLA